MKKITKVLLATVYAPVAVPFILAEGDKDSPKPDEQSDPALKYVPRPK